MGRARYARYATRTRFHAVPPGSFIRPPEKIIKIYPDDSVFIKIYIHISYL
jgi:hypothetical protein